MRVDLGKALNGVYEQIHDLKNYRHNDLLQRRNAVVDVYGYEFESRTSAGLDDPATFRISASQDCIYWYRLSFRLEVFDSQATNFQIFIEGINLTPFFKAQWNGQFVNGNGIFPNDEMGRYDLLDVAFFVSDEEYERLLRPGDKEVRIYGNAGFTVKLYLYEKYNHVGR